MKKIGVVIGVILCIGLFGRAYAESDMGDILKAVVKVRSSIPEGAASAEAIETEQEGSGVVIDPDGTILTVGYLVRDAETIEVATLDGNTVSATLTGYDYDTGFGLVKPDAPLGVAPIKLGHSSAVGVGDLMLVADDNGAESAQAVRVISRMEFAGSWEYLLDEAIYTAPVHRNFTGAALLNPDDELVGIGSLFNQIVMKGFGVLSCNVFIPIDLLNPVLANLKDPGRAGKVQRPWLGINAEESYGRIVITKIIPGGPAEKAGLKPGDMILAVGGKEVKGLADFYRKVWALGNAGASIPLSAVQGIAVRDITVNSIGHTQHIMQKSHGDISI